MTINTFFNTDSEFSDSNSYDDFFYLSSAVIKTNVVDANVLSAVSSAFDDIVEYTIEGQKNIVKVVTFFNFDGDGEVEINLILTGGASDAMSVVGSKVINNIFVSFSEVLAGDASLGKIWFDDFQRNPFVVDFAAERAGECCLDCKVNVIKINEYFSVKDKIGVAVGLTYNGKLCIGCLEARLGRRLFSSDFRVAPLNWVGQYPYYTNGKSERLVNRIVTSKKALKNNNFYTLE